jgi:hypothetical protein
MKKRPTHQFIVCAIAFVIPTGTQANDGIGQVGVGGVIAYGKNDKVAMRKEVLEISPELVNVKYEFVNESNKDVTLPVVFPLPRYGTFLPSPSWYGQPAGFVLRVNGQPMPFRTHVRAVRRDMSGKTMTEQDVTAALRKAGLSDEQIALLPGTASDAVGAKVDGSPFESKGVVLTQLKKNQLTLAQVKELKRIRLVDEWTEEGVVSPLWNVYVTYAWTMDFPAGKPVTVEHIYAPFISGGAAGVAYADELRPKFCADDSFLSALKKAPKGDAGWVDGTVVDYILTTANTWKGPIRDFTLRLKKADTTDRVTLCFPGQFKRVDTTTLESTLSNFTPWEELSVQYIRTQKLGPFLSKEGEPPVFSFTTR